MIISDTAEQLVRLFERFPGIGPRQAERFVYYLLSSTAETKTTLADLIKRVGNEIHQCKTCQRFWSGVGDQCSTCNDKSRDKTLLMVVEKDQDIAVIEQAQVYHGYYFVLGGVLTLSGRGEIREKMLMKNIKQRIEDELVEIILALSVTSEGEHTADYIRTLFSPLRPRIRISMLGRGLATGTELEYADSQTLSGAFLNRKES